MSRLTTFLAGVAFAALGTGVAAQETCGGQYTVQRGDTLSLIADELYKNAGLWSAIYQANIGQIGDSPDRITVGSTYSLPCIDGMPRGLPGGTPVETLAAAAPQPQARPAAVTPTSGAPATATAADLTGITLLTADDYAPFTDRGLSGGGLITEIVRASMEAQTGAPVDFGIHWVNDWSAHLDPLLSNAMLDMGFPWLQPDCAGTQAQNYRCVNFHFSDPMFEMLILLFTATDRPLAFRSDADIVGRTLCRPAGYFTHDLDKNGRNWIAENKITLVQPDGVSDCFDLLVEGEVDAVALNEFTGRAAIKDLGLEGEVEIVQTRPLSIEGLHVLVHKGHPQAEELVTLINAGLAQIKDSGEYQRIIDAHMSVIWADL